MGLETIALRMYQHEEQEYINSSNLYAREQISNPVEELRLVEGSDGIFNVTALEIEGKVYLFGREVPEASPWGLPDVGSLVLARLNSEGNIDSTVEVWNPGGKDFGIEDPRAHQTLNGTTIGVTVVAEEEGKIKTYPGIIKLGSPDELLTGPFPDVRIINKFGSGDQTTPLGGEAEGKNATTVDENRIMYRPENQNHTLRVLECTDEDAVFVADIDFPTDIPWATYKIGTTTPPEWLNDNEAFFVIHGINIVDGKFIYSIGTARLLRHVDEAGKVSFSVDNISREAVLTPDSFPELADGREVELHPDQRRALYNCGAITTRGDDGELLQMQLFPNQGDKRTWSAVLAASEIMDTWDRRIAVRSPEPILV
jgi:hypothetical protein